MTYDTEMFERCTYIPFVLNSLFFSFCKPRNMYVDLGDESAIIIIRKYTTIAEYACAVKFVELSRKTLL